MWDISVYPIYGTFIEYIWEDFSPSLELGFKFSVTNEQS